MQRILMVLVAVTIMAGAASAAPVTIPPGGTWAPVTGVTLNQNGTPFWDQTSFDGTNQNVGFQLQTLLGAAFANLEYLTSPTEFVIGGTGENVQLKVEVAGQQNANQLYYNNGSGNQLIFNGLAAPGASFAGTIAGPFSFVFYSNGNAAQAYATNDAATFNQFALFRIIGTQQYYLGIEDLPLPGGDRDYNDMIVAFELQASPDVSPVPEPGSLMLIGFGLIGGAARLRRRTTIV